MIDNSLITEFIVKIIQETNKGNINWIVGQVPDTFKLTNEPLVDLVYNTEISNKRFRIFKFKTKHYRDEYEWDWIERIAFELIDEFNNSLYEFPYDYSLFDLYTSVRERNSGIFDIIGELLEK